MLEERKNAAPEQPYVASLYHKGLNKILEKVGEESVEAIIARQDAAASGDCQDLIYETADLWFHSLVMLSASASIRKAVLDELERRLALPPRRESARQPSARTYHIARLTLAFFDWKHWDRHPDRRGTG